VLPPIEEVPTDEKPLINVGGRPRVFDNVDALLKAINNYLNNPPTKSMKIGDQIIEVPHITVTRMAYELGFKSRSSLYEYKEDPRFADILKRACLFIESEYETMLHNSQCTGAIFVLKNMGWSDKQEIDMSGGLNNTETAIDISQYKQLRKDMLEEDDC